MFQFYNLNDDIFGDSAWFRLKVIVCKPCISVIMLINFAPKNIEVYFLFREQLIRLISQNESS